MTLVEKRARIISLILLSSLCLLFAGIAVTADSPTTEALSTQDTVSTTATEETIRVGVNDSSNGADSTTVQITVTSTGPNESQTPDNIDQELFTAINNIDGTTSGTLNGLSGRDLSTFRTDLIEGNLDKEIYDGLNPSGRDYSTLRTYLITG